MIAVIGGTGDLGRGLVCRLALTEEPIVIGSRDPEKADRVASEMSNMVDREVKGAGNLEATRSSDTIFLTVPSHSVEDILGQIMPGLNPGDVVVSTIVPISRQDGRFVCELPGGRSIAEITSDEVPEGVKVVSGFQFVPASGMQNFGKPIDLDIAICGDDEDAKEKIFRTIEEIPGARAIDAGPLIQSELLEVTATLLVELTRIYGNEVGIRFKGI